MNQFEKKSNEKLIYSTGVDIWAIGCIAMEMIIWKPLFPSKNDQQLMDLHMSILGSHNFIDIYDIPPEIKFGKMKLLMNMLIKKKIIDYDFQDLILKML